MKKVNKLIETLFVILLSSGIISCAKKQVAEPYEVVPIEETKPEDLTHKVSFSGETLAMIANWYTGKSSHWKLIKEANPKIKPEKIALGQEIIIPGKLVVQRNPLTKKFVQESFAKRKVVPSSDTLGKEQPVTQNPGEEKPEHGIFIEPSQVAVGKETPDKVIREVEEINKEVQDETSQKSDKSVNNDEEREKLLDELLTQ